MRIKTDIAHFTRSAAAILLMLFLMALSPRVFGQVPKPDYHDEQAVCYSGQQVQGWQTVSVEEMAFRVSPALTTGGPGELNHHRIIVDFTGEGTVQVCIMDHHKRDLQAALAKPRNHTPPQELTRGKEIVISSRSRSEGVAWLLLATSGDVRITDVRWVAWRGKGTIYGHAPGSFQFAGARLPYRLMYPAEYDPAKRYPLVISVSGSGGVGSDNERNMEMVILGRFLFSDYYHDPQLECFSLVPQIPPDKAIPAPYWPAGPKGAPDAFHPDWSAVNENGWYVQATLALIQSLIEDKTINIDPDRIYYTGFSYGGKACWEFLKAGREMFAGAICGGGWAIGRAYSSPEGQALARLRQEAQRYKHIPVLIFAGARDRMRLGSKAVHQAIQTLGGKSTYLEFRSTDHIYSAGKAWLDAKNIQWLFEQNRQKNPPPGGDPYPEGVYPVP